MGSDDGNVEERHLQFVEDEEAYPLGTPRMTRQLSVSSQLSIHNPHYRRGSTDPAHTLPIQFRTV